MALQPEGRPRRAVALGTIRQRESTSPNQSARPVPCVPRGRARHRRWRAAQLGSGSGGQEQARAGPPGLEGHPALWGWVLGRPQTAPWEAGLVPPALPTRRQISLTDSAKTPA